jgi:hypothetical protein
MAIEIFADARTGRNGRRDAMVTLRHCRPCSSF